MGIGSAPIMDLSDIIAMLTIMEWIAMMSLVLLLALLVWRAKKG